MFRLVAFVLLLSFSVFAADDALLVSCRDRLALAQYLPSSLGVRPADLVESVDGAEQAVTQLEGLASSTVDRDLAVIGRLWVADARAWIERQRAAGNFDAPNRTGGFIMGLSRFDEAAMNGTRPYAPVRPPLIAPVTNAELPQSTLLSSDQVRALVTAYQAGGNEGLDAAVAELRRTTGAVSFPGFDDQTSNIFLNVIAEMTARELTRGDDLPPGTIEIIRRELTPNRIAEEGRRLRSLGREIDRIAAAIRARPELRRSIAVANSVDQYLLDPIARIVPREAFEPRDLSLPAQMADVVSRFIADTGFAEDFVRQNSRPPRLRDTMTEILQDERRRNDLAAAAQRDLVALSNISRARTVRGGPARKVDILFIGAGLHEQNMQNYLAQNYTGLVTETIERRDTVGWTFSNGDLGFSLNSSSRLEDILSLRQLFGIGDLNFLPGGIVQVSLFAQQRNPPAQYLGQAIRFNRALSGASLRLEDEALVAGLNPEADAERYRYRTQTMSGAFIDARSVIQMGIGDPTFPPGTGLREAHARARARATDPRVPPGMMTYPELFTYARGTPNPMRPLVGKKIAILGYGDSGRGALRWLNGDADPRSYGRDTSRTGLPALIPWYGQPCNDCNAFVQANRPFYAGLGAAFRSRAKPKDRWVSFEELPDGRYRLFTAAGPDGTGARAEPEIVDHIIICLGFDNPVQQVFGEFLDPASLALSPREFMERSTNLRLVQGWEPSLGLVNVARQIRSRFGRDEDIYFLGPLAGQIQDPRELRDIEENFVANANSNWRVWRFIEALALRLNNGRLPTRR